LASEDAIIGTSQGAARVASVERLKGLLDYVEQIIKLDERPAFKLPNTASPPDKPIFSTSTNFMRCPVLRTI